MANIIDKGQITLQDGSVMSWNITDDEVLTIFGALWDGSVTVGEDIKCIEHAAFSGCKNLKRVNLSEGLEIIGADSFSGCKSLETINFPGTYHNVGTSRKDRLLQTAPSRRVA